ncbi:MAG: GT4 family glycosyltransferase PelF [Candidatus Omnitrophica bacterium]|nr:GT4 family glycosyltransferase PelF [Candidatus Omnitrophota bacterium]
MNVLQILPELNVGGVERGTVDLVKHLVKLGHKAVVVSNGGSLVRDIEALGAKHYQLPVHRKSIINLVKLIPLLVDIIRKEEIDIVHGRSRMPAWIAYFACRRTKAVFITTCHGYYSKHLFSHVMGWAKRVIVPSNVIARHMIEDFGVPRERIRLVARSVDLDTFKYSAPNRRKPGEFHVGIIGRLTPIKGHLPFIKAMSRVARENERFKIWIVGDAPASKAAYKEQIRVLVKRLGLWHCTEFLGTQKNIPEILSHLDLLVLATTTQEAFGRVIIEAQAAGVPVVATAVGGVVDIIENGKTGLIVPPADPQAMSEAILKIMQNKDLAQEMAENAYKKVKDEYNLELMVSNTIDVYKEALDNFRVLAIKFSALGDVILSTAALRAIRERLGGEYKISFLVGNECKDILLRSPYIDELLVCDFKNKDSGLFGFLKLGRELRKKDFDAVIDLQNNRKSHILSFLTMAPERYGYDVKWGGLLNHRIDNDAVDLAPVDHQFRILKMLGIELKDRRLELWPTPSDRSYVDEFLKSQWLSDNQKMVGINISASKRWITKLWPGQHIIRLAEELNRRDIRVVFTGTSEDLATAEKLSSAMPKVKPINACAKMTVNQLACLIKRCGVYISADSAPLHIAASQGTAIVALFGPTDPVRHMPAAGNALVIRKELACSPCYKPKCRSVKCMKLISPEEVFAAVIKLLK